MFIRFLLLCFLILSPMPFAHSGEENWTNLFNGKDLNGWVQRGGKAKYTVEDGAIVGTSVPHTSNSFLCTDRDYSDFVLELDFKVDHALNSGVQIRSQSLPDYKDGRVHGYQVEIDPKPRAWSGGIYDEGRRGWLNNLEGNDPARKAFKQNEWNHFRIVAVGDSIKTWINGVPAADLKDDMTPSGFIALQVHCVGDRTEPLQVRWKDIRLKDLGEDAWVSLFDGESLEGWKPNENPESVKVEDGTIVAGGGPRSHLFYVGPVEDHDFKNFEFRCEVMTKPNSNSGIFFHTEWVDTGRLNKGYEAQINATHEDPKKNGSLWIIEDVFESPVGDNEWFTYSVKVYGKRIVLKINGEVMVDYTEPEIPERPAGREGRVLDSGTFALQAHDPGSIVYFKDIEVKVLPDLEP